MKTREEEIRQAVLAEFDKTNRAVNYNLNFIHRTVFNSGFYAGVEWSDEHPKNPLRDAAKDAPKNDDNVIIFIHGKVCEGYFNVHDRYWYCREFGYIETPRYWMPMPELEGGER